MSYGRPPPRIDGMVSLKVDNLTYRTTPEDLRRVFERCGEVGDIYIPRDRFSRESRGFAFVRFYDKRDAEDALDAMDGRLLDGRELRVQMARYGRPSSPYRRSSRRRSVYFLFFLFVSVDRDPDHVVDLEAGAGRDHDPGLGTRGRDRGAAPTRDHDRGHGPDLVQTARARGASPGRVPRVLTTIVRASHAPVQSPKTEVDCRLWVGSEAKLLLDLKGRESVRCGSGLVLLREQ